MQPAVPLKLRQYAATSWVPTNPVPLRSHHGKVLRPLGFLPSGSGDTGAAGASVHGSHQPPCLLCGLSPGHSPSLPLRGFYRFFAPLSMEIVRFFSNIFDKTAFRNVSIGSGPAAYSVLSISPMRRAMMACPSSLGCRPSGHRRSRQTSFCGWMPLVAYRSNTGRA